MASYSYIRVFRFISTILYTCIAYLCHRIKYYQQNSNKFPNGGQEKQATNLAHFIDESRSIKLDINANEDEINAHNKGESTLLRGTGHGQRVTVNVGIGQLSQGTAKAKEEHYAADLERCKQVFY